MDLSLIWYLCMPKRMGLVLCLCIHKLKSLIYTKFGIVYVYTQTTINKTCIQFIGSTDAQYALLAALLPFVNDAKLLAIHFLTVQEQANEELQ